jgi:type VI secretion system secreted protein VgrG
MAATQQDNLAQLAEVHNARDYGPEVKPLADSLYRQAESVSGVGPAHPEFSDPQLVLSSPAGLALTTPESAHIHAGDNLALTAERQISFSSNRGFMVTALKKISLFAHRLGVKIFAGWGKAEIQAQSDNLDIIADRVIQIITAKDTIHISSPTEIILTANGSYLKIDSSGVESGTDGNFTVHSSSHNLDGPKTQDPLTANWNKADPELTPRVLIRDELGRPLDIDRYAQDGSGEIDGGADEHDLKLFDKKGLEREVTEQMINGLRELIVDGNKIKLTKKLAKKDD